MDVLSRDQVQSLNEVGHTRGAISDDTSAIQGLRRYLELEICRHDKLSDRMRATERVMAALRAAGLDIGQWDYDGGGGEVWAFDYNKKQMGVVIVVKDAYRAVMVGFADGPDGIDEA